MKTKEFIDKYCSKCKIFKNCCKTECENCKMHNAYDCECEYIRGKKTDCEFKEIIKNEKN